MDRIPEEGRERWSDQTQHQAMVEEAMAAANLKHLEPAVEV